MSEEACAYYLRSDRIEDAFELLDRWNRQGFVYPPCDGWVTFVVADTDWEQLWVGPGNRGVLLRFEPMTAYGWHFDVWQGSEQVASYGRWWLQKKIDVEPANLVDRLISLFPYLGEHRGELPALLRLEGRTCDLNGPETVRRFAELLKLFYFDGLTFQLLDKHPGDALNPESWLAYDPLFGVPIDAAAPSVNSLTGVDLVAPRILYATRKDAEREWLKLTRKVWKGATWADVLQEVEMVRLGDLGDGICLMSPPTGSSLWNEKMWRLHVVGDCLVKLRNQSRIKLNLPPEEIDRRTSHASTVPGNPFWFEVGRIFAIGEFIPQNEKSLTRRAARDCFERLVNQLPELIRMQDSFQCPISPSLRNSWVIVLVQLATECGWNIPRDASTDMFRSPDETVSLLIDEGVILREGDRYRLNDHF